MTPASTCSDGSGPFDSGVPLILRFEWSGFAVWVPQARCLLGPRGCATTSDHAERHLAHLASLALAGRGVPDHKSAARPWASIGEHWPPSANSAAQSLLSAAVIPRPFPNPSRRAGTHLVGAGPGGQDAG